MRDTFWRPGPFLALFLCAVCAVAVVHTPVAVAKDKKTDKKADKKAEEEPEDDTPFLKGDKQTCKKPLLRMVRPNDSWQYVDLAKIRKKAAAAGRDVSGMRTLRFRLWNGTKRASVYVWAWIDPVNRDKEPLTPEIMALGKIKQLKGAFKEPKMGKPKKARIGKRVGASFQITGTLLRGGKKHAIVCTTGFRPADKCCLVVQLECSPDQVVKLSKDLKKLLKKFRF
jgi:hypothetical protein